MVTFVENKKIDFLDHAESAIAFFSKLRHILSKIWSVQPLLESRDATEKDLERAFKKFKDETEKALKGLEVHIINTLKSLNQELDRGVVDEKGLNVEPANRCFRDMNRELAGIQDYRNDLPELMENLTKNINAYINDFNKTVENYPKIPESGKVIKINNLK